MKQKISLVVLLCLAICAMVVSGCSPSDSTPPTTPAKTNAPAGNP